jgi:RNA-directed DNA polymerase
MWLRAPIVEEKEGKRMPPTKNDQGTPQGGVISPLLANIYLHWFDKTFHQSKGPAHWAKARLVRYADDFVVMARYQGETLKSWIETKLEERLGLVINREKTRTVQLKAEGQILNFLGYSFRYEKDRKGRPHKYLSFFPSAKAMEKEREKIRELTGRERCFMPTRKVIEELNEHLRGWKNYYRIGYCQREFRKINWLVFQRVRKHLNRRSQRGYRRNHGMSDYAYLKELGLQPL